MVRMAKDNTVHRLRNMISIALRPESVLLDTPNMSI